MTIEERFERVHDEYGCFVKVKNKMSERSDLNALLLIDKMFPNPGSDILSSAAHDEVWMDATEEQVETLTDSQIKELVRCSVRLDEGMLCMFV